MKIQCCICWKIKDKGVWREQLDKYEHTVSHGYCPECSKKEHEKLQRQLAIMREKKS